MKNKIWFIGLPLIPIYFAGIFVVVKALPADFANTYFLYPVCLIITVCLWAVTVLFNVRDKCLYHIKDFSPEGRRRFRRSGLSKDKLKAMYPPIDKSLLSNKRDGIIVGKAENKYVRIPLKKDGRWNLQSVLVMGGSGSGKSTMLLENLINNEMSGHPLTIFATDLKNELFTSAIDVNKCKHAHIISNDCKHAGWDAYFCISQSNTDDEILHLLDQIAHSLIAASNERDKFFEDAAIKIFKYMALYYYRKQTWIGINGEVKKGFADAVIEINSGDLNAKIKSICEDDEMRRKHEKIYNNLFGFIDDDSDTFQGFKYQLNQHLPVFEEDRIHWLFSEAEVKASPLDLDAGIDIYLAFKEEDLTIYGPVINLIITETIYWLMKREENSNPVALVCDELPRYGHISLYEEATSMLRSHNVMVVSFAQSLNQLEKQYGPEDSKTIMENCPITISLVCKDPKTAQILSEWSPRYDETKKSYQRNAISHKSDNTENIAAERRHAVEIPDLYSLKSSGECMVWIDSAKTSYMRIEKLPYFKDKEINQRAIKNRKANQERLVGRGNDPLLFYDEFISNEDFSKELNYERQAKREIQKRDF